MTAWTLRYHDLLDPGWGGVEATGSGLREGLDLLWRREAAEGILDDGARSFSAFSLQWDGGRADLPLGRRNPGLARLRDDGALLGPVVEAHLRLIERSADAREAAGAILALAEHSSDAAAFLGRLSKL